MQLVVCVAALSALGGCSRPQGQLYEAQFLALGTLVNVVIWDADPKITEQATGAVAATLNEAHNTWHAWHPGRLDDINQNIAAGRETVLTPQEAALLHDAIELSRASGGLFNPALGRLIGLWGFHADDRPPGPPPSDAAVAAWKVTAPAMADLSLVGNTLSSDNPTVQLDLGAIAKGYAVGRAIDALHELGVANAIVNAGGDLRAVGRRGDRPWRIGIRDPRGDGVIASVELGDDESVFTSGDYERYFEYEGTRYHHILDPRTGYPAQHTTSVTVIHSDPTRADAAATALFVAGPENWLNVARALALEYVMLIDTEGTVYMTPAIAGRLHFEKEPPAKKIMGSIP